MTEPNGSQDYSGGPMAELHCHIDGLTCPAYFGRLRERGLCQDLDLDALRALYPIRDMTDWEALGEFLEPHVQGNGELLLAVLELHLAELVRQNVRYVEIMLSSFLPQAAADDELMARYMALADSYPGIDVGLLWAIGRSPDRTKIERRAEYVTGLWDRGYIHGIALASTEDACTVRDHADIFADFARRGMPVEIHAGEWCGVESIWDALDYGSPRRLGHALCLFDDPQLPRYLLEHDIHVEFCPTSNLKVGGIPTMEEHPVFKAMDIGLNFSINTDDPGHFDCTMASEFALLNSIRGLDKAMHSRILDNSLRSAFTDTAALRRELV